jgi:DNA-binding NtrC family response regulator
MATLTLTDGLGALAPAEQTSLKSRLLAYERGLITRALAESGGNQRRAARQLGILPTTLHEKLKRLGLRAEAFLPPAAARTPVDDAVTDGAASA